MFYRSNRKDNSMIFHLNTVITHILCFALAHAEILFCSIVKIQIRCPLVTWDSQVNPAYLSDCKFKRNLLYTHDYINHAVSPKDCQDGEQQVLTPIWKRQELLHAEAFPVWGKTPASKPLMLQPKGKTSTAIKVVHTITRKPASPEPFALSSQESRPHSESMAKRARPALLWKRLWWWRTTALKWHPSVPNSWVI